MSETGTRNDVKLRLCRLYVWSVAQGLGFHLHSTSEPPYVVQNVESNSPAAEGGLKICDVVLAVNGQNVCNAPFNEVRNAIKTALQKKRCVKLLVIENKFYNPAMVNSLSFKLKSVNKISCPKKIPNHCANFPENTPRTCEIHLNGSDESFGFEIVSDDDDIGAFIQEVYPGQAASMTPLRKCDRIIEINDEFVDNQSINVIKEKLDEAKRQGSVKLYVVDTHMYKYYKDNELPLGSEESKMSSSFKKKRTHPYESIPEGKE